MAFDLKTLKAKVAQLKESSQAGEGGDWPKTTFLPDGNHKGRFIVDPTGELFIEYDAYGYFNRGIRDPDAIPAEQLPAGFVNELGRLVETEFRPRKLWRFGKRKAFLIWFYLVQTNAPSEDWQPGNLYCLIGNKRLKDALTNWLGSMAEEAPEDVMASLSPSSQGIQVTVENSGGPQGKCAISVSYPLKRLDPIALTDHVYTSLEDAYIKPGFNKEKYTALVAKYREEVAKLLPVEEYQDDEDTAAEEVKETVEAPVEEAKPAKPAKSTAKKVTKPVVEEVEESSDEAPWDADTNGGEVEASDDPFAKFKKYLKH